MGLQPGAKLGPYKILSQMGEGGMREVWRARDTRLDRDVALKFSKAEFTERFSREVRPVAQLNHPHICTLHGVGPNYQVMEFVDVATLKGPLPVQKPSNIPDRLWMPSTPRAARASSIAM